MIVIAWILFGLISIASEGGMFYVSPECGGISAYPPAYSADHHAQSGNENKCSPPFIIAQLYGAPSGSQRGGQRNESVEVQRRIANLTFWLVIVGAAQFAAALIYGFYARRQWIAIHRQANVADRALKQVTRSATGSIQSAGAARALFRATHRPRLIVRNIVIDEPDIANLPPNSLANPDLLFSGQAYVVNVGGSGGTLKDSGCWVFTISGELPMRLPYENREGNNPISNVDLAPGTIRTMQFSKLKNELIVGGKAWDRSMGGEPKNWNTYLMGWVMYVDGAQIVRASAFCRRWDIDKQRFVPVDNPDYENAD